MNRPALVPRSPHSLHLDLLRSSRLHWDRLHWAPVHWRHFHRGRVGRLAWPLGALSLLGAALGTGPLRAEPGPPAAAPSAGASPTPSAAPAASQAGVTSTSNGCAVRGTTPMSASTKIYQEPDGTQPYARFTGADTALEASGFTPGETGRAAVRTGSGSGSFRLDGFVDKAQLPVRLARDVAAVAGHVWIGAQQQVEVLDVGPQKLEVAKRLEAPFAQTFKAWAPCDALTFTQAVVEGWAPEGSARGYLLHRSDTELFDAADGQSLLTLHRSPYVAQILAWSTEQRGAWVHLTYHGPVLLDGWVRARDLRPLPRGETADELAPPGVRHGKPALQVQGSLRSVRTKKELPLRIVADESSPLVGHIEAGTETLVLDIVAGWASVLPKALTVVPDGHRQFWVLASDLDLGK